MQRGIITITKEEAMELLNLIPETQKQTPLFSKVSSANVQEGEEVELQLSEEETEIILDNIGVPEKQGPSKRSALRTKMQQFLMKLRQHK